MSGEIPKALNTPSEIAPNLQIDLCSDEVEEKEENILELEDQSSEEEEEVYNHEIDAAKFISQIFKIKKRYSQSSEDDPLLKDKSKCHLGKFLEEFAIAKDKCIRTKVYRKTESQSSSSYEKTIAESMEDSDTKYQEMDDITKRIKKYCEDIPETLPHDPIEIDDKVRDTIFLLYKERIGALHLENC